MNKLTIPAILVATVMVAGIFAFIPVEQASTVHSTTLGTIQSVTVTDTDLETGDTLSVTCTDTAILLSIAVDVEGSHAAGDALDINVDFDGAATTYDEITDLVADIYTGAAIDEINLLEEMADTLAGPIVIGPNGIIELEATESADGGDEAMTVTFVLRSLGTCT